MKLIGLLYEQGEIPKHVYRNICREYYGKGLDNAADARYTIPNAEDKEAV